jgi:hypothetical protein
MLRLNSKNIGRISFFKYIGITLLILVVLLSFSAFISEHLKTLIKRYLVSPYLNEPIYFSVQIIIDLVIAYFIAGKIGKSIIEKKSAAFLTTFLGFITIWFSILCVAMCSEIIARGIEYGITLDFLGLGILIWMVMGGPLFLIIGAVQGALTSSFIGKDIKNKGTAYLNPSYQ